MPVEFHVFVLVFAIGYPVIGFISYQRLLERIRSGETVNRIRLYRATTVNQWLLCAAGVSLWAAGAEPWAAAGVSAPTFENFLPSLFVVVVAAGYLWAQLRAVRRASGAEIARYARQIGSIRPVIPLRPDELRHFDVLAVTAGIVEEFLWRGVLIWYLGHYMPLFYAAVASTFAFGLAHAYQGTHKTLQIVVVGGVFAVLYLATGSLLLPIILHATVDLLQGRLAHEIVRREHGPGATDPAAA